MPLDTEVKGDPDSLTATCDWLRTQSDGAKQVGDQVYGARGESEAGWGQAAGDAARDVMSQAGKMIDTLTKSLDETCQKLETHADDLRTVRTMMRNARDVARDGGLPVRGCQIEEPGPAPADPTPLPYGPVTTDQRQQHAADVEAQAAFERKAQAYAQASQIVSEARNKETDSQHVLTRFLSGTLNPAKLGLSLVDMTGGALAAVAKRTSQYREYAEAAMTKAERASKLATSPNLSFADRAKSTAIQVTNEVNAKAAVDDAVATRSARVIDRMPDGVKRGIRVMDAKLVPKGVKAASPLLKGAVKVGQRIPGAGLVLTGFGVGYDISEGKDPTQAVVSGGSSLAVGTIVGTSIGGPPGAVVGGLVGVGVGFVVDEVWPD